MNEANHNPAPKGSNSIEHKNLLQDALDQGDEVLLQYLRLRPTAYLAADIRDLISKSAKNN